MLTAEFTPLTLHTRRKDQVLESSGGTSLEVKGHHKPFLFQTPALVCLTAEPSESHPLPGGRAVWRKLVNGSITVQPANFPGCDHRRARSPGPDDGGSAVMTSMLQECSQLSPSAIFPSSSRSVDVNPPLQSAAMKDRLRSLFVQPGSLLHSSCCCTHVRINGKGKDRNLFVNFVFC